MKIEKINKDIFANVLHNYYESTRKNNFAVWKHKALVLDKDTENFYIPEKNCYYSIYNNKMLLSYITYDDKCHVPIDILNKLDCIMMLADIFDKIKDKLIGFSANYGYKLHYDYSYIPIVDTGRYSAVDFDFSDEQHYIQACNMINQEENGDWFMPDNIRKIVQQYKEHSVFSPDLLFFAKDNFENKLVGITISSFDKKISETDIDWFFILPQFHGKGAGRFLIAETVNRSKERSKSIRTGGTNEFYKKCGFIEKDCEVWATKEGFEFIASCVQPNVLP